MILSGDTTMIPLNQKLRLPPGYSGLFMPLKQQAREGDIGRGGVIDPGCQGEIRLLAIMR